MNTLQFVLAGTSLAAIAATSPAFAADTAPATPPSDRSTTGAQTAEQALEQAKADAEEEGRDEEEIIITGTQRLVGIPVSMPSNLGSTTPTTVNGVPFSRIVEPTTSCLPAKRFCQKRCWSTAPR